ncbi:MAG: hypothetical protein ACI4L2_03285 [Wujia sp.]
MDFQKKFRDAIVKSGKERANHTDINATFANIYGRQEEYLAVSYEEGGRGVYTFPFENIFQLFQIKDDEIKIQSYDAPYDPNDVSALSREDVLKLLDTIKNIIIEKQKIKDELNNLTRNLLYHADYIDGMMKATIPYDGYDPELTLKEKMGPIIFGILTCYFFITIPIAIKMYRKKEEEKYSKYNSLRAEFEKEHTEFYDIQKELVEDYYFITYQANVEKLKEMRIKFEEFVGSGCEAWCIDCIGEEFYSISAIDDIYGMIKSRRADSIKEAINQIDATKYRERMESAQQAILNATEMAAEEAVKQTAYSKETAKSAHESATYAKATAYNTRKAARYSKEAAENTSRFR